MNKVKDKTYNSILEKKEKNQIGKYQDKVDWKFFLTKKTEKVGSAPKPKNSTIVTNNPISKKKNNKGSMFLLGFIIFIGVLFLFMLVTLLFGKSKVQVI